MLSNIDGDLAKTLWYKNFYTAHKSRLNDNKFNQIIDETNSRTTNNSENRCDGLIIEDLLKKDLKIPEYQRPYAWSHEQVIALVEDLAGEYYTLKEHAHLILNKIDKMLKN